MFVAIYTVQYNFLFVELLIFIVVLTEENWIRASNFLIDMQLNIAYFKIEKVLAN